MQSGVCLSCSLQSNYHRRVPYPLHFTPSNLITRYWIPHSSFTSHATFAPNAPISGIETSTSRLTAGGKTVDSLLVPDSFNHELAGLVKIDFKALDQWLEEMSEIEYHPKDPFHRVDILPSGRRIKIEIDGTVLADTGTEGGVMSLWETNIPGRWYLPRSAVSVTPHGCPTSSSIVAA